MPLQTRLSTTDFVREYLALLDEGWTPDLEEYLMRVPDGMREDVFRGIDMALAERETRAPAGAAKHVQEYAMMLADDRAPEPAEYLAEVQEEIRDAVAAGIRVLLEERVSEAHEERHAADPRPGPESGARVRTSAAEMAAWFARSLHENAETRLLAESSDGGIQAGLDAAFAEPAPEGAGTEVGEDGAADDRATEEAGIEVCGDAEAGVELNATEEAGIEVCGDAADTEQAGIEVNEAEEAGTGVNRVEEAGIEVFAEPVAPEQAGIETCDAAPESADGIETLAAPSPSIDLPVGGEAEAAGGESLGLDLAELQDLAGDLAIHIDAGSETDGGIDLEAGSETGGIDTAAEEGAAMCEAVDCASFEPAPAEDATPSLDEVGDAFAEPVRDGIEGDAGPADETDTSTAPEPPPAPPAGGVPQLAGYLIADTLGPKAFAGRDEGSERRVVVKVAGPRAAAKALAAAESAAALNDPDCVAFHTVVEGDVAALVADYVEGTPLDEAMPGLDWPDRARVLLRAARALARAHAAGVVHRGLKPSNLIVTAGLEVRIVDWGTWTRGLKRKHAGLPLFAAPEQLRHGKGDEATDVYGLGATMYAALTGRAPFLAPDHETLRERVGRGEPDLPRSLRPAIPAALESICLACLTREPHRRPSMDEVAADLERFLEGEPARLRPRLYADLLLRRTRQHTAAVEELVRGGLVERDDADRLGEIYRRVVERETCRASNPRLSWGEGALYAAALLAAADGWIFVRHGAPAAGPLLSWLAPAVAAALFLAGGLAYRLRGDAVRSGAFLLGGLGLAAPALYAAAAVFGFAPPALAASGGALLLGAAFLALSRFTVFSWATAGAAAVTGMAAAAAAGLAPAVGLLPLVLLLPAGVLLESRNRSAWAQPFHLVGLGALLFAPIALMAQGAAAGAAPHLDSSLGVLALHGVALAGAAVAMRRFGSLDLRVAARVLEPVAALYLFGVLAWNAHVAATAPAIGLLAGAGVFLAALRGRLAVFAPAAVGVALALVLAAV